MPDTLADVASAIAAGLQAPKPDFDQLVGALFGTCFHKRHWLAGDGGKSPILRDAYGLAGSDDDSSGRVPYGGLINADNPPSGPYGGMSIAWFPTQSDGSLISFVIGTRGLSPDEGILTRPGHHRKIAALRRHLSSIGIKVWSKPDPAAIGVRVPRTVQDRFPAFAHVFKRYGEFLYCLAEVPKDPEKAKAVVGAFFHLYAYERGWNALAAAKQDHVELIDALRQSVFEIPTSADVHEMLRERRFVILQGPPGTGKTRMARQVKREFFNDRGLVVQFHPSVTYEDFVVGLSPRTAGEGLQFHVRPGWLTQACTSAADEPALLIIDEINRTDLGKVLGEAIYLFEPGEPDREVQLPHPIDGNSTLKLPEGLFVLGTLNTADRSIASLDLAIRRRFAFMTMMPDREPIEAQNIDLATDVFRRLGDVFIEHAPDDALSLMPGHSYFLASDESALRRRFRYELLPLLDEYLREGLLGPAAIELQAERDVLADLSR